jgi:hypothetical protein
VSVWSSELPQSPQLLGNITRVIFLPIPALSFAGSLPLRYTPVQVMGCSLLGCKALSTLYSNRDHVYRFLWHFVLRIYMGLIRFQD